MSKFLEYINEKKDDKFIEDQLKKYAYIFKDLPKEKKDKMMKYAKKVLRMD